MTVNLEAELMMKGETRVFILHLLRVSGDEKHLLHGPVFFMSHACSVV